MTTLNTGLTFKHVRDAQQKPIGLEVTGFIPFDGEEGFTEEAEGASYSVPLKARGADGKLYIPSGKVPSDKELLTLADFGDFDNNGRNAAYDALPVIKDGKVDMYVLANGTLTTDAWSDANKRNVKRSIVQVPRKASDKRFYIANVTDANIVWPDDKIRKMRLEIKANQAMTQEEFKTSKTQATQKRQATTVSQALANDSTLLVNAVVANMRAQNKSNDVIRVTLESMNLAIPEELKETA